jgi:hypothetical protein
LDSIYNEVLFDYKKDVITGITKFGKTYWKAIIIHKQCWHSKNLTTGSG